MAQRCVDCVAGRAAGRATGHTAVTGGRKPEVGPAPFHRVHPFHWLDVKAREWRPVVQSVVLLVAAAWIIVVAFVTGVLIAVARGLGLPMGTTIVLVLVALLLVAPVAFAAFIVLRAARRVIAHVGQAAEAERAFRGRPPE